MEKRSRFVSLTLFPFLLHLLSRFLSSLPHSSLSSLSQTPRLQHCRPLAAVATWQRRPGPAVPTLPFSSVRLSWWVSSSRLSTAAPTHTSSLSGSHTRAPWGRRGEAEAARGARPVQRHEREGEEKQRRGRGGRGTHLAVELERLRGHSCAHGQAGERMGRRAEKKEGQREREEGRDREWGKRGGRGRGREKVSTDPTKGNCTERDRERECVYVCMCVCVGVYVCVWRIENSERSQVYTDAQRHRRRKGERPPHQTLLLLSTAHRRSPPQPP